MGSPNQFIANANVVAGTFPNAIAVCEALHQECLALVAESIESPARRKHQELVTLALAVAQLAHSQMSLVRLESPHVTEMASALARTCEIARRAFEARTNGQESASRPGLTSLLALAERTFLS